MPIEIDKPVLVKYTRDDGSEYDDVGFWILPRLSWQDFRAYMDMANTFDPNAGPTPEQLDPIAEFLIAKGFVKFEGVLMDGVPLSKANWKDAPDDMLMQIVRELQRRNSLSSVTRPNSSTPSAPVFAGDGRALPQSPPISDENSSTPKTLPTESVSPSS